MKLNDLENEFNFQFPPLYHSLEADGMLNVGEYGPNWYSTIFPKLKDNPTLFLHTYDFELLNLHAVKEAIEDLADPENYRQIKTEFKFIPFGQSGAGDHYCFFVSEQEGEDIPIVFVWHDMNEVVYLAKNLNDYMFKVLLTDMAEQDIYNEVSDQEFKEHLQLSLKTHARYLTQEQQDILHTVVLREIKDYEIELANGLKESYRGLLTDVELAEIIDKVIPFDKMETSFEYS